MELIQKYFDLSPGQVEQFAALSELYAEWNSKINVISRKDIDNLYLNHVLHSLAIAKVMKFKEGSQVLDLGTGGGFPGIPLAIMFPQTDFLLVDSINKKLTVVQAVSEAIELSNTKIRHSRVEDIKKEKFDFVVTRAVATIDKLRMWTQHLYKTKHINSLPNGLLALKGSLIADEMKLLPKGCYFEMTPISKYFSEPYFEEKSIVYLQA